MENWDPLEAVSEHSHELIISARKREMQNILKSYVGFFDPFAELIQNAMDAVDARARELGGASKRIFVKIDLKTNTLTVADAGIGFNEAQFKTFLCPNISYKDGQVTRGKKGVGATYLAYGFNHLIIATKTPEFSMYAEIRDGRKWLDDFRGLTTRPKVAELTPNASSVMANIDRGSSFTLRLGGENTRPKDLRWINATTAEQWRTVLLSKTPLGHINLGSPDQGDIEFNLEIIDASGVSTAFQSQKALYIYPHKVIPGSLSLAEVIAEQQKRIENNLDPSKLPDRFREKNAIYAIWNASSLAKFFPGEDESSLRELITKFDIEAYGFFCYSTRIWDYFNDEVAKLRKGQRLLLRGGLQLATDGMPQGELLVIPLTSNIGYQNQTHIIVHFRNADPDLGRKGFQPELREAAERISTAIVGNLKKWRHLLRKDSGATPSIVAAGALDEWIQQQRQHETDSPLEIKNPNFFNPTKEISITSTPVSEQDVIVLFNQLIAGGVIRGIKLMATSSHQQYDGIFRFVVTEPLDNHVFDASINPLGVSTMQHSKPVSSKPYVLEYKQNIDALIQEFENQEKQEADIDMAVAWEIGTEWKKRYSVTSLLDVDNIQHRPFHGVTHVFRDVNSGDIRFYGIILSELIEYLNDFEAATKAQRMKYGDVI